MKAVAAGDGNEPFDLEFGSLGLGWRSTPTPGLKLGEGMKGAVAGVPY